MNKSGKLRSAK